MLRNDGWLMHCLVYMRPVSGIGSGTPYKVEARGDNTVTRPAKIAPARSFPRKRESTFLPTDADPRLGGGDNIGDFHPAGWAAGPWPLGMTASKRSYAVSFITPAG